MENQHRYLHRMVNGWVITQVISQSIELTQAFLMRIDLQD